MVLTPDLHLGAGPPVALLDVEDEVVPLTPDVFPLHPPLLVYLTVVLPAQNSRSCLIVASLQVHGQPGLVDQRLPLPLPEHSVTSIPLLHHRELIRAVQTQAQTIEMAEEWA